MEEKKTKSRGRPFKKGVDARRGSKPKGACSASTYIRKHIKDADVAMLLVQHAEAGDKDVLIYLANQLWGKPIQATINENKNENKVSEIVVRYVEAKKVKTK